MARMHEKGKPREARASGKTVPDWVEYSAAEIQELVVGLGKKGTTPAMIGQIMRDKYGIPSVKALAGKSTTRLMVEGGVKMEYPHDMLALIERAVTVRKHLKDNPADTHNRTSLLKMESKIRRLVKYYTSEGKLPKGWRYEPETAALLVK